MHAALVLAAASLCATPAPPSDEDLAERAAQLAAELRELGVPVRADGLRVERRDPEEIAELLAEQRLLFEPTWFEAWWCLVRELGLQVGPTPDGLREAFMREVTQPVPSAVGPLPAQVAWYLPSDRALVFKVDPGQPAGVADHVVAHELVHAAQDQREGLRAIFGRLGPSFDGRLVARCLVEGEAEVATLLWRRAQDGGSLDEEDVQRFAVTTDEIVQGGMLLHYGLGRAHVLRRFVAGGWDEVRSAFARPPASGEQLLHQDKLGADEPVRVLLPLPDLGPGVEVRHDDVFGELGLYMLLAVAGVPRSEAYPAAAGWDGDRLRVWRTETGHAFVWRTVWDRELDAQQLERCLSGRVRGTVRRAGKGVDWIGADDDALRERLAAVLRATPFPDSGSEPDAATTAAAELEWARVRPPIEDGHQVFPELRLRVPVPDGWSEREVRGLRALFRDDPDASFSDNLLVSTFELPPGTDLDQVLDEVLQALDAGSRFEVLDAERVELSGTPCLWLEYRQSLPGIELRSLEVQFLRDGTKVSVAGTVKEERWAAVGPVVERTLRSLEL